MTPPSPPGARPEAPAAAAAAEGRARAYALLADLVARGPVPALLPGALLSPPLARALPDAAGPALEEAAADHQRVFGREVFPFEGAFLDGEGSVGGGAAAEALGDLFRRAGFAPDPRAEEPEHLATLLRALSFLSGAEADAVEDGLPAAAARADALARELLDDHLLRWLPALTVAVERRGAPFPSALAAQVEDLVLLHRAGLGPTPAVPDFLDGPDLDLDDPETGLDAIAVHLARPALAGVPLAREDVARAARAAEVPRGFGDRATEIGNLLRAAAHLDRLGAAVEALDAAVAGIAEALAARAAAGPLLAPWIGPWLRRAARTRKWLALLAARAGAPPLAPGGEEPR